MTISAVTKKRSRGKSGWKGVYLCMFYSWLRNLSDIADSE